MLSANSEAPLSVEELWLDKDFRSTITREKFEELAGEGDRGGGGVAGWRQGMRAGRGGDAHALPAVLAWLPRHTPMMRPAPCPLAHEPAGDFWTRAATPLLLLLERNEVQPSELGGVELLGGTSRVPRLKAALSEALGGRVLDM